MNHTNTKSNTNQGVTVKQATLDRPTSSNNMNCGNGIQESADGDDWEVIGTADSGTDSEDGSSKDLDIIIPLNVNKKNQNVNGTNKNVEKQPVPQSNLSKDATYVTLESSPESAPPQQTKIQNNVKQREKRKKTKNKVKLFQYESFVGGEERPQPPHEPASNQASTSNVQNNHATKEVKKEVLSLSEESSLDDFASTSEHRSYNRRTSKKSKLDYMQGEKDIVLPPKRTQGHVATYAAPENHHAVHCRPVHAPCPCSHATCSSFSSSSHRVKRKRDFEKEWKRRERLLKTEFVRKMKKAFCKMMDSLEECVDEEGSVSSSVSSEDFDDYPTFKEHLHGKNPKERHYQPRHDNHYNKERPPAHESKTKTGESDRSSRLLQLKQEALYWKNKIQAKPRLSPEEIRARELEKEIEYWKKCATENNIQNTGYPESIAGRSSTFNHPREPARRPPISTPRQEHRDQGSDHTQFNGTSSRSMGPPRCPSYESLMETDGVEDDLQSVSSRRIPSRPSPSGTDCDVLEDIVETSYKHALPPQHSYAIPKSYLARMKFNEKEKNQIVKYIVDNPDYIEAIKGKSFWIQMAADLETHRTWQSIKNNFFNHIMKNLEKYEMPDAIRNQILTTAKNYV